MSDIPELGICQTLCLVPEDVSNESLVRMRSGRPFTGAEITVAAAMSRMMALATSPAVMLEESTRATSELRRQVVSNREPQEQIVPLIVEQAGELFGRDRIAIRLIEVSARHSGRRTFTRR